MKIWKVKHPSNYSKDIPWKIWPSSKTLFGNFELESIQIKNIYLVTFTQTASGNEASKLYLFNKETIAVSAETVTECRDKIGLMYRTRTLDKHLLTVSLPEDFYLFYKIAEEEADYEELKTIPQPILPKPKDTELLIPNKKVFVEAKKLELIL